MAEGGYFVVSGDKEGSETKWKDTVPSMSSLTLGSEYVEPVVCREHSQEFKYFCKTHMLELCLTCRRMGHKNCETVIDIEQAAEEIFSDDHGDKIMESVKELREQFEGCNNTAESLRGKLPGKRQNAIDNVKQARKFIDDYLDELEADALVDIDEVFKKESEVLDERKHVCKASGSSLTATLSSYEKTMSIGTKGEKFLEINRATKQTKQYCNMLLDMSREMSDINVIFKRNDKISDLKNILRSLGTVSVSSSPASRANVGPIAVRRGNVVPLSARHWPMVGAGRGSSDPCIQAESKVIYTGEIRLKKVSDENKGGASKTPGKDSGEDVPIIITAFDVLPDGRRLVLDMNNKKLQLYDKYGMFLTECSLPVTADAHAFSFVLIEKGKAMITTGSKKVIIVEISNQLAAKEITANYKIVAMTNYGEDIIVSCLDYDGVTIATAGKNLKTKRQIIQDDRTLFKPPLFLAVNAEQNTVYVLDALNGCFGITMDGQVLFHYQDPKAECYSGLGISSDGLFIGVRTDECREVQKLSFSGNRESYIDFGDAYPLKVVENELVLYMHSEAVLRFYCLLK